MLDYMKALHLQFSEYTKDEKQAEIVEQIHGELIRSMDKPRRKQFLRLMDAESQMREDASLESFITGFKLAWGIAKELEADGLYSYEKAEELRICERFRQEVQDNGEA